MGRYNFIPRTPPRFVRETSYLASPLNFDSRAHVWKQTEASLRRNKVLTDQSSQIRQQLGASPSAPGVVSNFHPFKIYPPSPFWPNSASWPTLGTSKVVSYIWRVFRVRNGLVCTAHAKGINVEGTDDVDFPYDDQFLYKKDGTTAITDVREYVVNEGMEFFYFWIEIHDPGGGPVATLRYGPDPTVATYTDPDGHNPSWTSTNAWTGWDVPDSTHFLIGWVDTMSQFNKKIALIRQIQTVDILTSSVGNVDCPYG